VQSYGFNNFEQVKEEKIVEEAKTRMRTRNENWYSKKMDKVFVCVSVYSVSIEQSPIEGTFLSLIACTYLNTSVHNIKQSRTKEV